MSNFINTDFLFILLCFFIITLKDINPWVVFIGGIVIIITGIITGTISIVKFIHYLQDRKKEKGKNQ